MYIIGVSSTKQRWRVRTTSYIQVNGKFAQRVELRIAAQRSFMIDGRTVWADERGSGSKSKLYRCSEASFDAKANGDLRKVTKGCPDIIYMFM